MAYNEFAYFYDEFNGEADYDALYAHIHAKLKEHGIHDGILADLGCGTGELTLMLTQAGYDMIGIDQSEEMLCVVRDKAEQLGLSGRLLLLRQDLLKLDLYGTIRGAVSTFDTFNHIPDLDTAIANAGFFMEKGGDRWQHHIHRQLSATLLPIHRTWHVLPQKSPAKWLLRMWSLR